MNLLNNLQQLLHDDSISLEEEIQSLWSGYGQIVRCQSKANGTSYIVKVIAPEKAGEHPRGWNTSTSHERKLRSYQVEVAFYKDYANLTDEHCKVPHFVAGKEDPAYSLIVMEDLDDSGYFVRKETADWHSLALAIRWLAFFHVRFMGEAGEGLWPVGTYWHLDTRQDELNKMPQSNFKTHAGLIDGRLSQANFQTLVHGDAKFQNLCFHHSGKSVAAVDFQYVGRGSGVKDLAYLAGSCLHDEDLRAYDSKILNEYLTQLKSAIDYYQKTLDINELEAEIRQLYPIAWADFYRFLLGWNPQSWKVCDYLVTKSEEGLYNAIR